MGTGASRNAAEKRIYVEWQGSVQAVVFSASCATRDFKDLLGAVAKVNRWSSISLASRNGDLVVVSPSLPANSQSNPYVLTITTDDSGDREMFKDVLDRVAAEFSRAFEVAELKEDLKRRMTDLEQRASVVGLKAVEIDKCKADLAELREEMRRGSISSPRCYNCLHSSESRSFLPLKREVPSYPKYTLSEETREYLKKPTFDIWHWEANEMLCLLEHMYHELGLVNEFSMNPIVLKRWLLCVQENYRNNPFHNFRHCFCVTQMMYGMIHLCNLQDFMSRVDLGILLTACICHDVDHPGYNNAYQVNARTELAIRYNDMSPLENHHCAVAFQILGNPECNIFANVDKATFMKVRSGMIKLILGTDMAHHSEILGRFKDRTASFSFDNEEDMEVLKMMLVKCCDISNEVRPTEVSEPWVDCLLEEYFNQGDREKREGLPVAPLMDRDKMTKPSAQIGFIKYVLIPLFQTVSKLFPQLEDTMITQLRAAQQHYAGLQEIEDILKEDDKKQEKIKEKLRSLSKNSSTTQLASPVTTTTTVL
ncbi:high affinity cGMP-specific 3',5'-cyclic phosphodiesterase 9A-like [Oscarella lobularis]|uniref:high affinity cGMP-specific 3',5'-cyclic phosphodiesterase 9A-like n=1 Tax=Oscarella lobularis TaxID=121494 RepID=UPI0033136B37